MSWPGLLRAYAKYLPVLDERCIITLQEGNTPLLPAPRLAQAIGFSGTLFLKLEGQNPTGSFKDRGMTVAVSQALGQGTKALVCASTGNTSASAAAYAARAGLRCVVLIPDGKVALGKLSQAAMHGAEIVKIRGNFDQALDLVRELSEKFAMTLVNSVNPFRIEGQKTAAFEICDTLGEAPDFHALPVGNAGNITAYWKGYCEYRREGRVKKVPRMLGFQAAGAAPIVTGQPVANPETIATAIRIGRPASWTQALQARDQSQGVIEAVTDTEILAAYDLIARHEGVFCEPASAAPVAGVRKLVQAGFFQGTPSVVCTLTGHGLKDPETAVGRPFQQWTVDAKLEPLVETLGLKAS